MRTPRRLFDRRRPDYYGVLGVAEDAHLHEIESAYWRRACDRSDRDGLPLLNTAYEVLAHQEHRGVYDAKRMDARSARAGLPERRGGGRVAAPEPMLWPIASGLAAPQAVARPMAALETARKHLRVAAVFSLGARP
ncbi:MAG: hypothetical protein IH958_06230 [Chloroflexi bacterium]|nr:hypothetical protein [Chloroflexota bacterium]